MRTGIGRTLSGIALAMLATGCATKPPTGAATATEAAICDAWRDSLPTRSRDDTARTRAEIGRAYDVFLAACEGYALPFAASSGQETSD